jgi:hypothetical protein
MLSGNFEYDLGELMFCANCGKGINASSKFCDLCGTPIVEPPDSVSSTFAQPVSKEKNPANKKIIFSLLGSFVAIGALVIGYLVFFPAPLSAKDLRISLNVPVSQEFWEGDKIEVTSSVEFYAQRDATYKLVLETKNTAQGDWIELTEVEGKFPGIDLAASVDSINGDSSFRVLVYDLEDLKPLSMSDEQTVSVKKAFLPEGCSEDDLNTRMGLTYDPMTLYQDKTPTSLSCSMAYPNSDVFGLYANFEIKTDKQFASMKRKARGKAFSANMGESAAYRVDHPNEGLGAWTDFVVNYHGVVLTTDSKSEISYLINLIVVK